MFFRPTAWDLVKMLWWSLWNPPPPIKAEMVPATVCPTCKRPY